MSRLFEEHCEQRNKALVVLDRVKKARQGLKVYYERIDDSTWIERCLNPESSKNNKMSETVVTRMEAEQAIAIYRTAKNEKLNAEAQMMQAERIIEAFGRSHLAEFAEGRLELDSGTLAVKAGTAKPLKNGRPLSTAARSELASLLPEPYVRRSCDFAGLFGCPDKMVRQLLAAHGIEIVREDRFVVL